MKLIIDNKVEAFLKSLPLKTNTRVAKYIDLLENHGYMLGPPYAKYMGNKLRG